VTTGTLGTTQSTSVSMTSSSYTCTGSCSAVTSEGVCYSTTNPPTSPCTSDGTASPFNSTLTGILPNTTYYVRAFATNSAGTAYGSVVSFTTRQVIYAGGTAASGSTSANNFTVSYTPSATNNAVWVYGYCHGASLPTSMTVTATGWTFTSRISPVSNGTAVAAMAVAIAPNTSAANLTIEFDVAGPTPVPCNSFYSYFVTEATGNDPTGGTTTFDAVGSSGASTGGCNQAGAAVTPTSSNNLVWFTCVAGTASNPVSPWIQGTLDSSGNPSEYQSLAGGSGVGQAPNYGTTSGNYIVLGVAVQPTASSSTGPTINAGTFNTGTLN
jgi:hypothetical protein